MIRRLAAALSDRIEGWVLRHHQPIEMGPTEHDLVCRYDRLSWPCPTWERIDARATRRAYAEMERRP